MKVLLTISLGCLLALSIFVEVVNAMRVADSINQNRSTPAELIGTWGGDNLLVEITAEGATIDFGCARGSISEKILPDSHGKFSVKGFYKAETGGPTRQGNEAGEPAIYEGTITGHKLTFEVKLERGNESVGTFKAEKGKRVRLRRCG